MPVQYFDDERTWPARAQQIWQILVSHASNHQLITYKSIAKIIGFQGAGVLAHPLGYIMTYCQVNGLPPLTVIVINQESGAPGEGLTSIEEYANIDLARMDVFDFEWYKVIPPTIDDFIIAHDSKI